MSTNFCDSASSRAMDSAVVRACSDAATGDSDPVATDSLRTDDGDGLGSDVDVRARGRRSTTPSINTTREATVLGRPRERPRKFQTIPDPARPNTPIAANNGPISLRSNFFMGIPWQISTLRRESAHQSLQSPQTKYPYVTQKLDHQR